MQNFIDMLSKVIFFAIIATIVLAVVTYFAYKVREFRSPRRTAPNTPVVGEDGQYHDPMLFEKYGAPAPEKPVQEEGES
ncbi:MAG: hypothetical protein FJ098_03725 [Deltaproteobacteria bacterium]|nr:hypothetical protein [Deltaproteobacteria bacterium]